MILTTQLVRQGCSVSKIRFNLYLDDAVRTWKMDADCGFKQNDFKLSGLLYTYDHIILSGSENTLQKVYHAPDKIFNSYNLSTSIERLNYLLYVVNNQYKERYS